jgi:UDP-N-acetylmuramyl pentapeptide phosphotransferase/UDP-N-acetylglucosamine-1-phosphate transferase
MTHAILFLPLITFAAFALTVGLTWMARNFLVKRAVMDIPNERSMHAAPVPRGGGLAVMAVAVVGMALYFILTSNAAAAWLLAATLLLVGVSWLDDRRGASIGLRLAAHLFAAILGSLALPSEAILSQGLLPFRIDRVLLIAGWAWFMNIYNFMDGIDGMTGVETIGIATGVALLSGILSLTDPLLPVLAILLLGACGGFLLFNWHPAKIFLGDAGSVPLGFLTGFLLLRLAAEGHPAAAVILPLYYLADSGITFTRRLGRGEKIWQAHRQHFYQRAARGLGRHDFVVLWVVTANLLLIAAALVSLFQPWAGLGLAVGIVALLLYKMHKSASL